MGNAQINKPDFAYPKTTAKNAEAALRAADKANDPRAALQALVVLTVSRSLIDETTLAQSIQTIKSNADKYSDSDLAPLFDVLLADIYLAVYQQDMWKYDRRQLPLSPLPENITEWSGDQFKHEIAILCEKATQAQRIAPLTSLSVKDYADLIEVDDLGAVYYATLADFVYSETSSALQQSSQPEKSQAMVRAALDSSQTGSPQSMLWMLILNEHSAAPTTDNIRDFKSNQDNPYSGILLASAGASLSDADMTRIKWFVETAMEYNTRYPDNSYAAQLTNSVRQLTRPHVEATMPSLVAMGTPFTVSCENRNTPDYTVKVYYLYTNNTGRQNDSRQIERLIKTLTPVQTHKISCHEKTPFSCDTALTITLDKPGYYCIVPGVASGNAEKTYYSITRCVPVVPVALRGEDTKVIVAKAGSGEPVDHAAVGLYNDKVNKPGLAYTNASGIADLTIPQDNRYYRLMVGYKGLQFGFDDIGLTDRRRSNDTETRYSVNLLTDRALYHPGDEVEVLAVACSARNESPTRFERQLLTDAELRITLFDANYQPVDTIKTTTDSYGRATARFTLPTEGLTGRFSLQAVYNNTQMNVSGGSLMVSDFKMPDFELIIDQVACDTPNKGEVTVKGHATTYSGMPLAGIDIDVILNKSQWSWWYMDDPEKIYSTKITTDADGTFTLTIEADKFSTSHQTLYQIELDAVSASGSTASATRTFALTEMYHLSLAVTERNVNARQPLVPQIKVTDPEGAEVDIPLVWRIETASSNDKQTVAQGDYTGSIDISALKPATYSLVVAAKDPDIANQETVTITVYDTESGIVPDGDPLWVLNDRCTLLSDGQQQNTVDITYATEAETTYIYYYLQRGDHLMYLDVATAAHGYHTLKAPIPADLTEGTLTMLTVSGVRVISHSIDISQTKAQGLKIEGESFRDNLIPGAMERWSIKVVNADGTPLQAALALDMYNKALEALVAHSFALRFPTRPWSGIVSVQNPWVGQTSNGYTATIQMLKTSTLTAPQYKYLSEMRFYPSVAYSSGMVMGSMKMASRNDVLMMDACQSEDLSAPMMAYAETAEEAETEGATTEAPQDETFDYREAEVPMAIWAPTLTTDAEGNICYTFTVPDANTTWRLRALAWSQQMEVGSLMRDFVASKPVMVQPNLPRFMRTGDSATLLATVMNNTDSTATVHTVVEIFNPVNGKVTDTRQYTQQIEAKQSASVNIEIQATDQTAIGYRVRSTCAGFSDGEQAVIRVLPSQSQLIETEPFYLNPGETSYKTKLPSESGARITLNFCENPAWTIVTALPGLRTQMSEYANSAAAALFSAAVAQGIIKDNPAIDDALKQWRENPTDSALISMLQRNEDLKAALLNATPWVQAAQSQNERMANLALIFDRKETDGAINRALSVLQDLQMSDGGWAWGKWCMKSSPWVTSNVLSMLGDLSRCGWLPADKRIDNMVKRAVRYYDSAVEDTDLLYCLVRPLFADQPVSSNGRKVIDATLKDIKKNWKKYDNPAYKAMAAEALWLNGEQAEASRLMASVAEFGVLTKSQGLKFPSVNALYDYAILLEAFGLISPQSQEVDGLRQQLIVRKQGTDWGDAVVTTEVVKSILTTGSKWTVPAQGASIEVGDQKLEITSPIETSTGCLRADLSEYAGDKLHITTTGAGPAYGAVYAQFARQMQDVKASGCDDLDIEKQLYVRRGTEWAVPDELQVGDRVKVQLTIHCKRNLQYVSIIDERPAAFEPVDQLPGWLWSEGVGFYRENRDSATTMHVVYMGPGTYLLTYEMNVNVAGDFSSGVATIQSQYAPEISAHSSGTRLSVK